MAPIAADAAARPAQKQQTRRPVSRIVPAIPHRLSRRVPAAAPASTEPPQTAAVAQSQPKPVPQMPPQSPAVEEKKAEKRAEKKAEEQPAEDVPTSLAPASKTLEEQPVSAEEAAPPAWASLPAQEQDEQVQQSAAAQEQGEFGDTTELHMVFGLSLTAPLQSLPCKTSRATPAKPLHLPTTRVSRSPTECLGRSCRLHSTHRA